jgi:hypothetical protein
MQLCNTASDILGCRNRSQGNFVNFFAQPDKNDTIPQHRFNGSFLRNILTCNIYMHKCTNMPRLRTLLQYLQFSISAKPKDTLIWSNCSDDLNLRLINLLQEQIIVQTDIFTNNFTKYSRNLSYKMLPKILY